MPSEKNVCFNNILLSMPAEGGFLTQHVLLEYKKRCFPSEFLLNPKRYPWSFYACLEFVYEYRGIVEA